MKSINITNLAKDEHRKHYYVFIGSGRKFKFKSKRDGRRFLAETNRFLTSCVVAINDIYINVFREYRYCWFMCLNINGGTRNNFLMEEQTIRNNLHAVEEIFIRSLNTENRDAFMIFINLNKLCMYLSESAALMIMLNKRRNNTIAYHNLNAYKQRAIDIQLQLKEYGTGDEYANIRE